MNCFDFDLENGDIVLVEYGPGEDDERGLDFEIYVFDDTGKDIWYELSEKDQAGIQAQIDSDWQEYVRDQNTEAAISRWESQRDFP